MFSLGGWWRLLLWLHRGLRNFAFLKKTLNLFSTVNFYIVGHQKHGSGSDQGSASGLSESGFETLHYLLVKFGG